MPNFIGPSDLRSAQTACHGRPGGAGIPEGRKPETRNSVGFLLALGPRRGQATTTPEAADTLEAISRAPTERPPKPSRPAAPRRSTGQSPRLRHRPTNTRTDARPRPARPDSRLVRTLAAPGPPAGSRRLRRGGESTRPPPAVRVLKRVEAERRPPDCRRAKGPRPLRRVRGCRPSHLPRPGHRPVQEPDLAGPRRGARDAPHARGVRRVPDAPPSTPSTPRPRSSRRCSRR